MPNCLAVKKTSQNLLKPCQAPAVGVRPIFYLGFISQLQGVTRASGDDKTITGLIMKTGEKLTKIEGYKTSNNFSTGFNATDYANFLPHTGVFTVFDQSSGGLKQVDILANVSDGFIITQQSGLGGNWRVLGINTGMHCSGQAMAFNDPNGGATNVTLVAEQEITTPEIFVHTTSALVDTDTYLASLAFADPS